MPALRRSMALVATATAIAVIASGCAGSPQASPSTTESASAAPSASTPSVGSSPVAAPSAATRSASPSDSAVTDCLSLLDADTTAEFDAKGWVLDPGFTLSDLGELGTTLSGGIGCRYGVPDSEENITYAWAPISRDAFDGIVADFTAGQGKLELTDDGTRVSYIDSYATHALYSNGFIVLDIGEGDYVDELAANAPPAQ